MRHSAIAGLIVLVPMSAGFGAESAGRFASFFANHCVACHDVDSKKGGLDLTSLSWQATDALATDSPALQRWVRVFDKVEQQEMPPPTEPQPDAADREEFLEPLRDDLKAASLAKQRTEGRVVLRRLNRVEYENTLHDLLAIDLPLQHHLPEDAPSHGFDNVAEGLRLSMLHMEQFLEAADAAITAALDLRRQPDGVNRRFRYHDEESVTDDLQERRE